VDLVFILGASNSDRGTLSDIALSRIEACVSLCEGNPKAIAVPTGGYGKFNHAPLPHRRYVAAELSSRGIALAEIADDELLSANTVEDALMIKSFCEKRSIRSFSIVTSCFHIERCRLILACVFPEYAFEVFGANDPANVAPEKLQHERAAILRLRKQGGVMFDGAFYPIPSAE
jgi:uncharacterized SAM-binding protein YcdF (DUF218 family)